MAALFSCFQLTIPDLFSFTVLNCLNVSNIDVNIHVWHCTEETKLIFAFFKKKLCFNSIEINKRSNKVYCIISRLRNFQTSLNSHVCIKLTICPDNYREKKSSQKMPNQCSFSSHVGTNIDTRKHHPSLNVSS